MSAGWMEQLDMYGSSTGGSGSNRGTRSRGRERSMGFLWILGAMVWRFLQSEG
jgi:hypothetical protein